MYTTHEQDHEKRKNQEGSYSLYNYIYHYLMDNFEPGQDMSAAHEVLFREAKAYNIKGGKQMPDSEINDTIKQAIDAFTANDGEHGDTANNFGKRYNNSFAAIRDSISDLKW